MDGRTAQDLFSSVAPDLSLLEPWRRELGCYAAVSAVLKRDNKGFKLFRGRVRHIARYTEPGARRQVCL